MKLQDLTLVQLDSPKLCQLRGERINRNRYAVLGFDEKNQPVILCTACARLVQGNTVLSAQAGA